MDAGGAQVESVLDPSGFLLAGAYAEALLGVLPDNAAAEELAAELSELVRLLDEVDGFEGLLTATLLSKAQRMAMVDRVFDGRCSETLLGLLGVLARNARLGLLRGVAEWFRRLLGAR
ncbi:MAG TPA: hypothetical protein DCX07_04805, partial [Phycisphaerales bacterium]|nr:hypothetical protein [Phycisphaerales bacterium]